MRRTSLLKQPLFSVVNDHLIEYPTPINFNYWYNFGSLAGLCLLVQILSGVFLAMHYCPNVDLAFNSVEHIMRDVPGGWFLRYLHANGASMFFITVYFHIGRGLYYGSYAAPREMVWVVGVVIFLLMILTAFMGYVLVFGQMSFWGATVITSLASAVPIVGNDITTFLWGGFSVDNPTLNRFFSLHYLFPFLIAGASIVHLAALHQYGSNNPLGVYGGVDKVPFFPYFVYKDILGMVAFSLFFSYFVYFSPNSLGDVDNYIPANPMVTPPHIVPEWYLLPFYAILRSIPNKLAGVLAMGGAFVALGAMPWLNSSKVRSTAFRPLYKFFFWTFVSDCILLGYIGQCPVEDPYILIGQIASLYYFAFFFIIVPNLGRFEESLIRAKVA
jgi:ubiquinol-cytochrome c reductase cytochrome b subunit